MPLPFAALIPLISSGIGALAGVGSNLAQAKAAKQNTDATNKANRELAEYSYSKDIEMWNRTNEFNLPSNQMNRLKDAGLNPNLIYGSGGATTQAAQMPKYNAPTMDYNYKPKVDPLSVLGAFQDFQMRGAQINNLRAQNRNIEADTSLKITNEFVNSWKYKGWAAGIGYENAIKRETLDKMRRENRVGGQIEPFQADMYRATLNRTLAESRIKNAEADFYDWGAWSRLLQGFGIKLPSFRK